MAFLEYRVCLNFWNFPTLSRPFFFLFLAPSFTSFISHVPLPLLWFILHLISYLLPFLFNALTLLTPILVPLSTSSFTPSYVSHLSCTYTLHTILITSPSTFSSVCVVLHMRISNHYHLSPEEMIHFISVLTPVPTFWWIGPMPTRTHTYGHTLHRHILHIQMHLTKLNNPHQWIS